MFIGKTVFVNSLVSLNYILRNPFEKLQNQFFLSCFCSNKYALSHYGNDKIQKIRIWNTNSCFSIWYDEFRSSNFVACLYYTLHDNHIKIDYMNINDYECKDYNFNKDLLDTNESLKLNHSLLSYIKYIAKLEKKPKIIVDVHQNLRIFNKYYKPEGFVETERKCIDNKYWKEAELNL